jgi:hypothetical protein
MTDFEQKLYVALWGAIAGGLMSLMVNLLFGIAFPRFRRWSLTRQISIVTDPPHGGHARFRVVNGGYWTIQDATLYIDLDFQEKDTMHPPYTGGTAHIEPTRFVPLRGDQLCWSVRSPTPNPMKVAIFAKERQPFSPCYIEPTFITIPSEDGWSHGATRRVFLRPKRYTGTLKLVSADTDARYFSIVIDPSSASTPCTVEPTCRCGHNF